MILRCDLDKMPRAAIDNLCTSFRQRLKSRLWLAGVCRAIIVALLILPPLLLVDWLVHLSAPWRFLALAGYLSAIGATLWWTLIAPLRRLWHNEEVLAYLDSVAPAGQGMLLELYQLAHGEQIQEATGPVGKALVDQATEELTPLIDQSHRLDAFHGVRIARWRNIAAIGLALFIVGSVPLREYLAIGCQRLFNPLSSRRWPHRTTIALQTPASGWTVPQLESLTIDARVSGQVPPQVTLAYRSKSGGYWVRERLAVRDDGTVRYVFPEVREPISFYVEGGDDTTDTQGISVIDRPYLTRIVAHYEYPEYAGLPNRDVEGGQLYGLEGTRVRLAFECSMPLKKAVLRMDAAGVPPPATRPSTEELKLVSATKFEKTFLLSTDGSYTVELYEQHGFREARPERYEIRVTPDNPPQVELLSPAQNLIATARASIPVALRASDDFGLKSIEFLYQIGDAPPLPLTDHITGPLAPSGKSGEARFSWDLRKMELPESAVINYFVRVRDVNPTGRGVTETARFAIKLLKPGDFHFETFEKAKRMEAEARIAWENQYAAWKLASVWNPQGSGKEDDPLWQDLKDKQELAIRAAKSIESALVELTAQYEQNDMARELMAGRLAVITELLRQVTAVEHPAIASALESARPRTDADASRLRELRSAALARMANNQKLATLYLERMLKRLFDWRDLQTTLVRTTLLHEEQGEVLRLTEQIAPKTIGWEIEDLASDVQDKLLTLGKRQRTLFDVESELEKEMEFQMHRAEVQQRRTILEPLRTAYKGLRDNRVNENLRLAAGRIEVNQAFQIVNNQKAALYVLSIVRGGLIQAGQKVDAEPPITLAMTPSEIIDVNPKPVEQASTQPTTAPAVDIASGGAVSPEELLSNLPLGGDPLTAAINAAWEAQDAVLARTRYLSDNSSALEMPRYVKMKRGILLEKQAAALRLAEVAIGESQKAGTAPVSDMLGIAKESFTQSSTILAAGVLDRTTQQLQADSLEVLDDLRRRYIPAQKAYREAAEENRKRSGSDAFGRKFVIRDKDLDGAIAILDDTNEFQVLERQVVRTLARFAKSPATQPVITQAEKANRARSAEAQKRASALIGGLESKLASLSGPVAAKVRAAGLGAMVSAKLTGAADEIAAGGKDESLRSTLANTAEVAQSAIRSLSDLLGEREQPAIAVAATQPTQQRMTLEEWQKLRSPEALRERLKDDRRLPPEVREIMLKSLGREFPAKYRELLSAYYGSFIGEEKKP